MKYRHSTIILSLYVLINTIDNIYTNVIKPKDMCKDKDQLISSDKYDKFTFVQSSVNETLVLECHFCSENDTDEPKSWFKSSTNNITEEVHYGLENDPVLNRISLSVNHSLVFREIIKEDLGIYYCKVSNDEDEEDIDFYYVVDVIFGHIHDERGTEVEFMNYEAEYIRPINRHLQTQEFDYLRDVLKLNTEVVMEFGPWNECDVCGRPPGLAIQESIGYCRILFRSKNENFEATAGDFLSKQKLEFLLRVGQISCRSYLLREIFPTISNAIKDFPDYVQTKKCEGKCVVEHEGVGWNSSKGFKYRKLFKLAEKSHLTFVCPETTMESYVVWKHNDEVIDPGKYVIDSENLTEPRVMADTFGTLYLGDVTLAEEGTYTCQVDGVQMQEIKIIVLTHYSILSQKLLRHMMYIGVVLALTSLCYCTGIFLVWRRRKNFKTYDDLLEEEEEKERHKTYENIRYENEKRNRRKDRRRKVKGKNSTSGSDESKTSLIENSDTQKISKDSKTEGSGKSKEAEKPCAEKEHSGPCADSQEANIQEKKKRSILKKTKKPSLLPNEAEEQKPLLETSESESEKSKNLSKKKRMKKEKSDKKSPDKKLVKEKKDKKIKERKGKSASSTDDSLDDKEERPEETENGDKNLECANKDNVKKEVEQTKSRGGRIIDTVLQKIGVRPSADKALEAEKAAREAEEQRKRDEYIANLIDIRSPTSTVSGSSTGSSSRKRIVPSLVSDDPCIPGKTPSDTTETNENKTGTETSDEEGKLLK